MIKRYKHKENDSIVKVDTRRGNPIVTKNGMIVIVSSTSEKFKDGNTIRVDIFEDKYEVIDD